MWRLAETFIASRRKKISEGEMADIVDPIQTPTEKYKKKISFMLFWCLCLFGFASYIICFQSSIIGMSPPIAETSFWRTIEDLQERSTHLNKTCNSLKDGFHSISLSRLYKDNSNSLLYCKVPKCGSTYWMRFFQVLNNITKKKDPFNTIRFTIHRMKTKISKLEKNENFNENIRFLVTRNPYSRLYSAYVDKLFLPEFWISYGRDIIKHFRRNATSLIKFCGNDVTFREFLKMIALGCRSSLKWRNLHWQPIEQICSPCLVKYNFIIKQETFSRDRDYLVNKVGIKKQSILNYNNISHWDYSLSAIKDLCNTAFMHIRGRKPKQCYKIEVLIQKLFVSFQIQGYIKEDAQFDLNRFGDRNKRSFTKIVEVFQNIYKEHPVLTRYDWEEQRKRFRKKAYKLVDTETLKGIKTCYDLDFKIFNYDPEPEEIFGNRKKKT